MAEQVSFSVSQQDRETISKIVDRAFVITSDLGVQLDRLSTTMDLTACHANGNPLRLDDLLAADRFNFCHDVFGIGRHLDRDTGLLTGFFSPRFSQREAVSA